jgi:hypothetical protein
MMATMVIRVESKEDSRTGHTVEAINRVEHAIQLLARQGGERITSCPWGIAAARIPSDLGHLY